MDITLHIGFLTVMVMDKSDGSGVKFQLISQKLTADLYRCTVHLDIKVLYSSTDALIYYS
jgi:hypothetical protein